MINDVDLAFLEIELIQSSCLVKLNILFINANGVICEKAM